MPKKQILKTRFRVKLDFSLEMPGNVPSWPDALHSKMVYLLWSGFLAAMKATGERKKFPVVDLVPGTRWSITRKEIKG